MDQKQMESLKESIQKTFSELKPTELCQLFSFIKEYTHSKLLNESETRKLESRELDDFINKEILNK